MTSAPSVIRDLVERFQRNRDSYVSAAYNEAQLRREFLDPFFKALGWDVDNESGLAEKYKDVVHEDSIRVTESEALKAPDYCFRIGGTRKFFVEAKKPSVYIQGDSKPAFQIRRYAWSAKLPLSILTNFEEFAVYDCRVRPAKDDKSSAARIIFVPYTDYLAKWDEIAAVFSKDAVLKGAFDRYAEVTKGKKGTAEVDADLLREIESWREELAHNIALRNSDLTVDELNTAVSRTIDRILFLRVCEDRGTEQDEQLKSLLKGSDVYRRLFELFHRADERYNSGLFHFSREAGRDEAPDTLTPKLKVDDTPLKGIIRSLYYPDCPYVWSQIPADILGQVYEQFLGKVIRLTKGHQAKVEDKPEVKKAGGVYYTPTYIVDYIVEHTVGKLLEGKTPKEAAKLRILDPACGSGSFLIGAYQHLLDWYLEAYLRDIPPFTGGQKGGSGRVGTKGGIAGMSPRSRGDTRGVGSQGDKRGVAELPIYQVARGEWRLSLAERKRILLDHIYGVDIDAQAVEVTKLSLLLKVLEGETHDTLESELKLRIRALPDLAANIKCGNSLIGTDFYSDHPDLSEDERRRINPFDWHDEFPNVFPPVHGGTKGGSQGGFDAVIGNPPYIRIQTLKEWTPLEVEFYKKSYSSSGKGNYDIYVVFVEKGLSLLNSSGSLGFILPHKFFNAEYGTGLRGLIAQGRHLTEVVHFGDQQVFKGATTYTCLLFLCKTAARTCHVSRVSDLNAWRVVGQATADTMSSETITESTWPMVAGATGDLFTKLSDMPVTLGNVTERIFQGLVTGCDPVFILVDKGKGRYYSEATEQVHRIEKALMHPLCKGSVNIRRYRTSETTKSILFPYELDGRKATLYTADVLSERFPLAWAYLTANRTLLQAREHGKWKHNRWYAFGRSQNLGQMEQPKIMTPSIASASSFTLDGDGAFYFVGSGGGGGGGYGVILKPGEQHSYRYILGLLNSRLLEIYLKSSSSRFGGGYYAFNRQYIEGLPIRTIDFSDKKDKARHDKMVSLVEKMLELNKDLQKARTEAEQTRLKRQIAATDRQIDQLVYELYGLTEEEIAIVEGSEKKT